MVHNRDLFETKNVSVKYVKYKPETSTELEEATNMKNFILKELSEYKTKIL